MLARTFQLGFLLSLMVLSIGCSRSQDTSEPIQGRTSARGVWTPAAPQIDPLTGQAVKVETSYVVADGSTATTYQNFQTVIKTLVSPQLDPTFVGNVDPNTGVVMEAFVAINKTTNAVIPSQSRVVLQISDEYTGQLDSGSGQRIPAITMVIPGANGTYSNGNLRMTYADCAGQVEIQGGVNGQYFVGNVFFTNSNKKADCKTALPGTAQRQFLGSFTVLTCGFMTCK